MDFCPRCGRYLKDDEFQCPECGNVVRQIPHDDVRPDGFQPNGNENVTVTSGKDIVKAIFDKYFFIAMAIGFVAMFAVTYMWGFHFILFCIPLFFPMGRMSRGPGLLAGMTVGSLTAILWKMYMVSATV